MELGAVTVDCVNSGGCGGRVALRVVEEACFTGDGLLLTQACDEVMAQTCRCELSEEQRAGLIDPALRALKRRSA